MRVDENWSSGDMCLRWTSAGILEAESRHASAGSRATVAWRPLAVKIEHHLLRKRQLESDTSAEEATTTATV